MKAVIQRVTRASVEVNGQAVGRIDAGLLVLLGVAKGDGETDGRYLVEKIRTLRIFSDEQGKMNRSLGELVPAYAQVCLVKTDRRIIGADVGTSTNICYTEVTRLRNV